MVTLTQLTLALAAASASYAAPSKRDAEPDFELSGPKVYTGTKAVSKRQDYNQNWTSGGNVQFSPSSSGYSVSYSGANDFVVGKGWQYGDYNR
jgi:endo-1,4-beta-xylanase